MSELVSSDIVPSEADTRLAPNYGVISYSNQLIAKELDFKNKLHFLEDTLKNILHDPLMKSSSNDCKISNFFNAYSGIKSMERTEAYRNKTKFSFGYDGDSLPIIGYGLTENDVTTKMAEVHPQHLKVGFISGNYPSTYIVEPISVTTNELHSKIAQIIERIMKDTYLKPFLQPPRLKKSRSQIRNDNKAFKLQKNAKLLESDPLDTADNPDNFASKLKYYSHRGVWKYLTVRTSNLSSSLKPQCMVILQNFTRYVDDDDSMEYERVIEQISQALQLEGVNIFVVTEFHKSLEPQLDDEIRVIYDDTHEGSIIDHVGTVPFRVSPFSFFQTNSEGVSKMYNAVFDLIIEQNLNRNALENDSKNEDIILFDLYCGTGTIGLYLEVMGRKKFLKPKFFSRIIGIDCVQSSIQDAIKNARLNEVDNANFYVGRCEEKIDMLLNELLPNSYENSDTKLSSNDRKKLQIVIDPSREGMNKKLLKFLAEIIIGTYGISIDNFIYCSCNVHSWMSDIIRLQKQILHLLDRKRKKLSNEPSSNQSHNQSEIDVSKIDVPTIVVDSVTILDMFPHTHHLEIVSRIRIDR